MTQDQVIQTPKVTNLRNSRLIAVDALRGLIIAFMALDHANHFVAHKHSPGEYWGGIFPVYFDPLAFMTRLVTHLAPAGFFLSMGIGMVLFAISRQKQGWSRWAVIRHFLIRGAVLVALQLLLVNRAWELHPEGWGIDIYIGVLIALGGSMILGSVLLWLKPRYLLALAAVIAIGAELLTPDPGQWGQVYPSVFRVLLMPGGTAELWVNYPVIQWLELSVLGMAFGHWLSRDAGKAYRRALVIGVAMIPVFIAVRYLDGFGNIRPRWGNDWMDFLNVVKYPPSIAYTLLTAGVNVTLLGVFGLSSEKVQRYLRVLATFGRTPLFFYVLHLFLYLGLGLLVAPEGTSITVMYPFWLLGLLVLYPLCLWYGRIKRQQSVNSVLQFL
jgi:uncharacterized membrane protein